MLKCVQTCSKLVQMYSNVFICVQTCSKLVLMWSAMGLAPRWRDIHMNTFIHSPVNPLLVDIISYNQSLLSHLCLVILYLPLLTFSIQFFYLRWLVTLITSVILITLITSIISPILYQDHLTVIKLKKKRGGGPSTHHPPQGRILTTFRLFVVARCRQRGRIWTNFRLFFVAGGGGLKSALFT